MKTKAIILIVVAAIATLSFVSVNDQSRAEEKTKDVQTSVGGFESADAFN